MMVIIIMIINKQQPLFGTKICEQFSLSFTLGPDNVQGQISKHIFAAKLRLLCLLSIGFKTLGILSDIPQFQLGNIRPCDTFRSIAHERKYLMDYNNDYKVTNSRLKLRLSRAVVIMTFIKLEHASNYEHFWTQVSGVILDRHLLDILNFLATVKI